MAGLYAESFENCDLTAKGWGSGTGRSTVTGRFDTNAQELSSGGNYTGRTFTTSTTVIFGIALKTTTMPAVDKVVFKLLDTTTVHIDVRITNTGLLKVTRNGTALGTGTIAISANAWFYFEIKVKIDDTTGTVDTKVNGSADLALTAQDTRNGGNASVNIFELDSGTGVTDFDDLYIIDTTGSNNTFLGDVRVESLLPNGNGNSSQFVGSDANSTDNYLLVDETSPNGDTDYVESSTVGNKDTYTYTNLTPGTGSVFFVQPCPYVRKSDAGTRSIVSVARVSATETDSAAETLSASYQHLLDIRDTKPGGGAWTISDVNSAEFGIKVNA